MDTPLHTAFIPNPSFETQGSHLAHVIGLDHTAGDLGVEIECEGNKFPKHHTQIPSAWKYVHDGSLRGNDNAEYVFKKPLRFHEAEEAIESLYRTLTDYGTVLDESNRTSVHVHLNVQQFHLNRLTSFLALYFMVEEVLTEWCGDHRIGNLFCLRAKDAPAIVSKIKAFIQADGKNGCFSEGMHYSGMNAHALFKFGSLEIRSLRGVTDPKTVVDWIKVLERLYNLSAEYEDPRSVTENFSGNDPIDFLRNILGDTYGLVRDGISLTDNQVRDSMYEGIRLAQDLCYCRDWSRYKPIDVSKDPFGRNKPAKTSLMAEYMAHLNSQAMAVAPAASPWTTIATGANLAAGTTNAHNPQVHYAPATLSDVEPTPHEWTIDSYSQYDSNGDPY